MWVNYKPVDLEIDDDNRGIFHVFELRMGMNEFDCSFLSLRKQQREGFSECSASCIVASYTFCNESINYCRISHPHQDYNEYLLLSSFQSFVCHINNSFCGVQRENNFPECEKQQSTPCPRALMSVSCPGCMLRGLSTL